MTEYEKQLWENIANMAGVEKAESFISLSHIAFERNDYRESLAMCETAKDLYEAEESVEYLYQIARIWSGIAINLQELGRHRESAHSAGEAVRLLRELQSPALGELLRDQGRYWFSAGEHQSSLDCHMDAMEIPDPDRRDVGVAVDLLNIGMAEGALLFHDRAIGHLSEARRIFKKSKEITWVAVCDELLAEVYLAIPMAEELEMCARRALDFAEISDDKGRQWKLNYYLAIAKRLKEEFDESQYLLDVSRKLVLEYGQNEWKRFLTRTKTPRRHVLGKCPFMAEDEGFVLSAGCLMHNPHLR